MSGHGMRHIKVQIECYEGCAMETTLKQMAFHELLTKHFEVRQTRSHHLVGSGWIIPNPGDSTTLQERQHCLCHGTSEEATPLAVPGSPDAPSQDPRFRTGLLASQTTGESFRFFRPPASNFARDHHHPDATVPALEFRASPLFVFACAFLR